MNIRQLECFIEVAKTLNFTRAAQNLFLSQTVVTNHIRHLEETIGFPVFERNRKSVSLTENGAILLQEARQVIESAVSCQNLAIQLKTGYAGIIRLAYIRGIEQCILTGILGDFYQKHPDIHFELFRDSQPNVQQMMLRNEVDGIFSFHPTLNEYYEALLIRSFPLVAAVSKNHPFASDTSVSYSRLIRETNVVFDSSNQKSTAPNLDNTLLKVAINSCTAVIPEFITSYSSYEKYIRYLPLTDLDISFDIYFVYRNTNRNLSFQRFLDTVCLLLARKEKQVSHT